MERIQITLKQFEEIVNSYNEEMLNSNLDDYLSFQMQFIKQEQISLNVRGLKKKSDQEKFKTVLHNYYELKAKALLEKDKYDDEKRFFLLLLGIILILISKICPVILSEIFLVAGWVAIWEMVSDILFREKKRREEIRIAKKLSNVVVTFEE